MAIITKPSIVKGEVATFSLSKSELLQHSLVVADSYFSEVTNWCKVNIVYKSSEGSQYETVEFDVTQENPTGKFLVSLKAKDIFQVNIVHIFDFDGGYLQISRSELNVVDFDIDLNPIVLESILGFSSILKGTEVSISNQYTLNHTPNSTFPAVTYTENVLNISSTGKYYKEFILNNKDSYGSYYSKSFGIKISEGVPSVFVSNHNDALGIIYTGGDTSLSYLTVFPPQNTLVYNDGGGTASINISIGNHIINNGDIFGIAIDLDSPTKDVYFHVNGIWFNGANPTTGLNKVSLNEIFTNLTVNSKIYIPVYSFQGGSTSIVTDPVYTPTGYTNI